MSMQSLVEIQPNMEVYTSDAVLIGSIKQVREHDMLIDRTHHRDIFVPFTFVNLVVDTERRVELNITEKDYSDLDWEHPSII